MCLYLYLFIFIYIYIYIYGYNIKHIILYLKKIYKLFIKL